MLNLSKTNDITKGSLILSKKFFLDKQIYNLSFHNDSKYGETILVGYAAGGYCMLNDEEILFEKINSKDKGSEMPLSVIGNLNFGEYKNHMLSVNLEGKIELHEPTGSVIWSLDLEEEITGVNVNEYSLMKEKEICISTWDGMTYIIDIHKNNVKFNFRDRICSFISGNYSVEDQKQELCIFYVTFNDKIFMYSDLRLDSIPIFTMIEMVETKASKELKEKLKGLSKEELTKLYNSSLYISQN